MHSYLHVQYNLLFTFTLLASRTCSPVPDLISKSMKAGHISLPPYSSYSRIKNISNIAPEISTSFSWFESRKLWRQRLTAPEKQMVS